MDWVSLCVQFSLQISTRRIVLAAIEIKWPDICQGWISNPMFRKAKKTKKQKRWKLESLCSISGTCLRALPRPRDFSLQLAKEENQCRPDLCAESERVATDVFFKAEHAGRAAAGKSRRLNPSIGAGRSARRRGSRDRAEAQVVRYLWVSFGVHIRFKIPAIPAQDKFRFTSLLWPHWTSHSTAFRSSVHMEVNQY